VLYLQSCDAAVNEDFAWVEELKSLQEIHASCNSSTRRALVESKKLDSSMKKNTAAIRKLKTLQESNAVQIMADLDKVNQSKVGCTFSVFRVFRLSSTVSLAYAVCQRSSNCNLGGSNQNERY